MEKEEALMSDTFHDKRILLVDDETELLKMVSSILKANGYHDLYTAVTATQALKCCEEDNPELAVLDVMLPDLDGFSLFERMRKTSDFPVLFLTARDETEDKLRGLGLGADDYLVKPFLPEELVLRVDAILRRCYKTENPVLQLAACTIDFSRAQVKKENKLLPLTATEQRLLLKLAGNIGKIVTIDALCDAGWGNASYGTESSLMTHIRRIREKIEHDPSQPVSLLTVRGLGYKLIAGEEK